MKKYLIFLLFVFMVAYASAATTFKVGGSFYHDGRFVAPDSIRLYLEYLPSGATDNMKLLPDSLFWDTTLTAPNGTDTRALAFYHIFYDGSTNPDTDYVVEQIFLRLDSVNITANYLTGIKNKIEVAGGLVWSLAMFWGACADCQTLIFPMDGTTPKDSAQIYNSSGVHAMTIHYLDPDVLGVIDSIVVIHQLP